MIRQCLCRSNDNTVTCMNTDGIKILHAANGDAVVIAVTDDLELDFLPSGNAALDEYLPNHRVVKPLDDRRNELFLILGNTTACAAHCIRRAYDDRISDGVCKFDSRMNILDNRALGNRFAEFLHCFLEPLAILRLLNCLQRGAEQFHAMLCENALLGKLHGEV